MSVKEELLKGYKHSLELANQRIAELSGPTVKSLAHDKLIQKLKQLDEPEKVKVPQFVADWYEEHKDNLEYDIWEYVLHWGEQQKSEFYEWMNYASNKPFQTLANMHQFGYEVEEEKRYYIRLKNVDENYNYLTCIKHLDAWALTEIKRDKKFRTEHTRKELEEAGFGEVFNSTLFEVEEVE